MRCVDHRLLYAASSCLIYIRVSPTWFPGSYPQLQFINFLKAYLKYKLISGSLQRSAFYSVLHCFVIILEDGLVFLPSGDPATSFRLCFIPLFYSVEGKPVSSASAELLQLSQN